MFLPAGVGYFLDDLKEMNIFTGEAVFAHEYKPPRKRYFFVIKPRYFCNFYFLLPPIDRTFFEII